MKNRMILTALATASLAIGGQALAQGQGGGLGGSLGGGVGGGLGGGVGAGAGGGMGGAIGGGLGGAARGGLDGGLGRGLEVDRGLDTRVDARANSQGPIRADARARARANENSVLRTNPVTLPDLSGLRPGLLVRDRAGATIGTVSRVVRSRNGTIRNVLVTAANGQRRLIRLAPNSLTISGNVVTTTALRANN